MRNKKIRVLVVDDSIVFREIISRGITTDPNIEVVATANDPFEARDQIIKYQPDVMTCDVEMPKMNGIEFIQRLMPQHPLPIIVVSSASGVVFDAMSSGAVDFIAKPSLTKISGVENFIEEMIIKIKIASASKIQLPKKQIDHKMEQGSIDSPHKIIAIGASTGGTEAIYSILQSLPSNIPGVVIVQHIPPTFSRMFAERLNSSTNLKVKEANTGDFIMSGQVLIAPGDQHMKVKKVGDRYRVECYSGEKLNGHCPSVDILFNTVAQEVGNKAIGIILTGMGYDGAKGLLTMRRNGARTLGQDEKTSVVYGMPKVAFNIGAVEKQAPLDRIPQLIYSILKS